jgi:hemerythrin
MPLDFITWNKEYSVDVAEIDLQHKEIMTLINALINHCSGIKEKEKEFFDLIMESAIGQIKKHFETEEEILCRTKYEKYKEHKDEHKIFLERLHKQINEIKINGKELNLEEITIYMKDWVSEHIETYDKKAKEYFKEGKENKE